MPKILSKDKLETFYPDKWDIREGVVALINKPIGYTSFDVVKKIRSRLRKAYGIKRFKVGHTGTLDPLASGLLLVLMGKATKQQNVFLLEDKTYSGTMELGYTTASYDSELEKIKGGETRDISLEDVQRVAEKFLGEIIQIPPIYSAIKMKGIPLYKYARKGKEVELRERTAFIKSISIVSLDNNFVKFKVSCGSGTYIRSLAHDMGQELGCGAYLSQLCRTAIGKYNLEDALSINELISVIEDRYY